MSEIKVPEVLLICLLYTSGLKPGHGDVGLGVELLCNPSTDGIQLNAIPVSYTHLEVYKRQRQSNSENLGQIQLLHIHGG